MAQGRYGGKKDRNEFGKSLKCHFFSVQYVKVPTFSVHHLDLDVTDGERGRDVPAFIVTSSILFSL